MGPLRRCTRARRHPGLSRGSLSSPQGFFADKDAASKAAGQKVPKKQAPAEQYADFLKAISGDVRQLERREEEEASEAALERSDRDDFEQR